MSAGLLKDFLTSLFNSFLNQTKHSTGYLNKETNLQNRSYFKLSCMYIGSCSWKLWIFLCGTPSSRYVTFSVCLSLHCSQYLKNCTSCDHNFCYTYVKWWYLQVFFSFFIIFIFWVFRGVNGQISQNEK